MQLGSQRRPSRPDDGPMASKKRNVDDKGPCADTADSKAQAADVPRIKPGERMADFAQRVNQALPLAGVAKRGHGAGQAKAHTTKHTRKLRRMQQRWRDEDARIREREEELHELAAAEQDELEDRSVALPDAPGKKRRPRAGDDDDPWEELKARRGLPAGLHDVAQAPPQLARAPRERFKVQAGARVRVVDVPAGAGSLRRREQLGEARQAVIEGYRRLMDGGREGS